MPKQSGTIVAIPTAYNVYRVDADAVSFIAGAMITQPPLIVLEALVMDGHAKLAKRIMMYNPEDYEDEPQEQAAEDEPDDEQLPGPWYTPDEGE